MRTPHWSVLPLAALSVPAPACAVQYLTVEQALRKAYPAADEFLPQQVNLTAAQWQAIGRDAPAPVAAREPRVWEARTKGAALGEVYVDEVLGKQLFITYAVAVDTDGRVAHVEILEYRETHGFEVRNGRWLAQFVGHGATDDFEFGRDIRNISGATLSCRHVTEGVRRLLAIHHARFPA
jgi:Na+-translocating ferredoxin:NAD+ oxidoreductase RnfG subunit